MNKKDLINSMKILESLPPAVSIIEVYPKGKETLTRSLLNGEDKLICDELNLFFGAKIIVVDKSDFMDYQARITYTNGTLRIINLYSEAISKIIY